MLAFVTNGWRRKAGALVVALYALCVVAPVASIAATHGPVSAHCIGEHQHGDGAMAAHQHAGTAQSAPSDHDHDDAVKCCGLFGVIALAPEFLVVSVKLTEASNLVMPRATSLSGSRGDRIDRPPRDLLSL
jgi:hypothetical protein